MRRNRKYGFTMAEVLIVVAIIAVLGGVAFVNVARYMRSMKKIEFDGYAKEIFIAAQNHLTMSASEGYLDRKETGNKDDDEKGVYYFVVDQGSGLNDDDSLIGLMLPFGSVDGTILYGGSYIVRYHPDSAQVLDVFYWSETDSRYKHTYVDTDYDRFKTIKDERSQMMNYPPENGGAVIGYYGGAEAQNLPKGEELKPISISVINHDELKVVYSDDNDSDSALVLFIEGLTSGVQKRITIRGKTPDTGDYIDSENNTVYLDVISKSKFHFKDLFGSDGFIPGENIRVWAKVYYEDKIGSPKESTKYTTNSLYANLVKDETGDEYNTAQIAYFRHLENLSPDISSVDYHKTGEGSQKTINIKKAIQINDLDWEGAFDNTANSVSIYLADNSKNSGTGNYWPITFNNTSFEYDGQNRSISNVKINTTGTAGLIGEQDSQDGIIHNLKLIDFDVTSTENSAGALVGTYGGGIENIIVITEIDNPKDRSITGVSYAGGLVGNLTQGSIEGCAASVYVEAKGSGSSAGGLIGSVGGSCTIEGCYSGGHTSNGIYSSSSYDVTSEGGTAGGLVGKSGGSIEACYSTCSVSANTAGGFIGTSSGSITNSYCTGLVSGTKEGAFAGTVSGEGQTVCQYYNIINSSVSNGKIEYMPPVSGTAPYGDITPFDKDTEIFQTFCKNADATARPYDKPLIKYYNGKYPLKSLSGLGYTTTNKFVDIHYGDWPMPMTFFTNTPISTPTPTPNADPTQTPDPTPTGTTNP